MGIQGRIRELQNKIKDNTEIIKLRAKVEQLEKHLDEIANNWIEKLERDNNGKK